MADVALESAAEKSAPPASWWQRTESRLERASEYLNPILVKEARQALKSRQFVLTFSLLLLLGWAWSLLGVALASPTIYYGAMGPFLLAGYYLVLNVPLLMVVPFAAFRSLAGEREDGTYELLSITTLSARQVVTGKLGSAVLQMLVYYSALAPCIAFTYLLRGVDILSIAFLLAVTFLISLVLSALGVLIGTASRVRHWQVLLSVLLVIGLGWVCFMWSMISMQLLVSNEVIPFDQVEFWLAMATTLTFAISLIVLFTAAAAAQLSFASENRSTRLRIIMLSQQLLAVGWFMFYWVWMQAEEWLVFLILCSGLGWLTYGALMIGERAQLSPRERRSLPQSVLGRILFTWFNPGSGTGYIFAVSNLLTVSLLVVLANVVGQSMAFDGAHTLGIFEPLAAAILLYVCIYVGLGRLILLLFRRIAPVGILFSFVCVAALAVLGVALPITFDSLLHGFEQLSYSVLQTPNWAWTLISIAQGRGTLPAPEVFVVLLAGAGVVLLLNLISAAREVEQVRAETPDRVQQDERQRHPVPAKGTGRRSPWDDEEKVAAAEGA